MNRVYLPDWHKLALIDRDWILDELSHLQYLDYSSGIHKFRASVTVDSNGINLITDNSTDQRVSATGTGSSSTYGTSTPTTSEVAKGAHGAETNYQIAETAHNHNLPYRLDEFESNLTLLPEIVDETQNKQSDFGLIQLLTSYARPFRLQSKLN